MRWNHYQGVKPQGHLGGKVASFINNTRFWGVIFFAMLKVDDIHEVPPSILLLDNAYKPPHFAILALVGRRGSVAFIRTWIQSTNGLALQSHQEMRIVYLQYL